MRMFEPLDGDVNKSVLFDSRWKMSERHEKCLTWLIMSVQRSWGKQRVAARRTTAASLCCAAGGRETMWVTLLISSVEKCVHLLKCKCSYFAYVLHDIVLFITMVVLFLCSPSSISCNYSVPPDSHCHVIGGVPPTSVSGLVDSIFMSPTLPWQQWLAELCCFFLSVKV